MAKKVLPAWKTLRNKDATTDDEYHALKELSDGLSDAGVHDYAPSPGSSMAAQRNGYDPEDYPIIAAGLRKVAGRANRGGPRTTVRRQKERSVWRSGP